MQKELMKMDPDFIELQAQGITQGATLKSAYILLFKEKGGNNLVPTLINKEEKRHYCKWTTH